MIRGITSSESDLIRVIMEKDGTMELCGGGEFYDGTWELRSSKTATSREYDRDTCVFG